MAVILLAGVVGCGSQEEADKKDPNMKSVVYVGEGYDPHNADKGVSKAAPTQPAATPDAQPADPSAEPTETPTADPTDGSQDDSGK